MARELRIEPISGRRNELDPESIWLRQGLCRFHCGGPYFQGPQLRERHSRYSLRRAVNFHMSDLSRNTSCRMTE